MCETHHARAGFVTLADVMPATATKPTRVPHTCHHSAGPCAACGAAGRVPVDAATLATMRTAMERTRTYRGHGDIESIKLPFHAPGADSYGPNGEQRFRTKQSYIEAGKRWSGGMMRWQ